LHNFNAAGVEVMQIVEESSVLLVPGMLRPNLTKRDF